MQSAQDSAPVGGLEERPIGLVGATGIGVGAIVGGGILALAGTAISTTGPGALIAFTLNGIVAVVTALSFAELATAYPRSGGTYMFAKRALSVGAAFAVGWIVWFASIVAAALYAMGFAAFAITAVQGLADALGRSLGPALDTPATLTAIAVAGTVGATAVVARSTSGGGNLMNAVKVLVFAALILGGTWVWITTHPPALERLTPLLPMGTGGLLRAMGYTFIALQGFDLVAAVAGEVHDPRRNLPRAMLLSLGVALALYVPLLLVVLVVGVPSGTTGVELATRYPDTLVAVAGRQFLGPAGFWLVVVAGVVSMASALLANLFAAARIAQAMSHDRTLPRSLERVHPRLGTPLPALLATAAIAVLVLLAVDDVGGAGAAASLIFLVTFALAQVLCIVSRRRRPRHGGFRVPWHPWLPAAGALACAALAVFQGFAVPKAGLIMGAWLVLGGLFYLRLLAPRARVLDAAQESSDPDLLELRGRNPLVLVPVANPANAGVMALLAACISPPRVGRVLLLNIQPPPPTHDPDDTVATLARAADVLKRSMASALGAGVRCEALQTISHEPFDEMVRVARLHRCASVLVGMSVLSDAALRGQFEDLAARLRGNLVVVRARPEWHPGDTRRVLVPIAGSTHNALRARLLSALRHRAAADMTVLYLLVLPADTGPARVERARRAYEEQVRDEVVAPSEVHVVLSDDVGAAIVQAAGDSDLLVLGLHRESRSRRTFDEVTRRVIADTDCPALVISQRQ